MAKDNGNRDKLAHSNSDGEIDGVVVKGRKGWDALGFFSADLEKIVAWHTGRVLVGYTVSRDGTGWRMVLRASKGQSRQVAFLNGQDMVQLWRNLWYCVHYGHLKWHKDKYAKD